MSFKLKFTVAALALMAAGASNAALTQQGSGTGTTGSGSSVIVWAENTTTGSWYARDTGYLLNSFLPNSVTTAAGDGGVTGTITTAGTTFSLAADSNFSTWYGSQVGTVVWSLWGGDGQASAGTSNLSRLLIAASYNPSTVTAPVNSGIRNAVSTAQGVKGLMDQGFSATQATGSNAPSMFAGNGIGQTASTNTVGNAAGLYYFATTQGTLANNTAATMTSYGAATATLLADGSFTYSADGQSAVPLPAAAWLLGSGLMGMGAMVRRRKASAQA